MPELVHATSGTSDKSSLAVQAVEGFEVAGHGEVGESRRSGASGRKGG